MLSNLVREHRDEGLSCARGRLFFGAVHRVRFLRLGLVQTNDEQSAHALLLALKDLRFVLKPSASRLPLVQELVVVVRLSARDLPRSRDLEPLYCGLVCFDLWHLSSSVLRWKA